MKDLKERIAWAGFTLDEHPTRVREDVAFDSAREEATYLYHKG